MPPPLSRRQALLAGLGYAASACHHQEEPAPSEGDHGPVADAAEPFGGLQFATGGELGEGDRGGTTLVLLHGFGASGDDLVSLARALARPRTRYIVPAAPLELPNGGRAWWPMRGRAAYNAEQELLAPSQKLRAARVAVQGLLRDIADKFAPESLFLVGFSQGAMLALDVALAASSSVTRVAVLSGALLDDAALRLSQPRRAPPAVFVSHGREDRVLRFAGAEHLVEALKSRGIPVTFRPFTGGHEIQPATIEALNAFLFDSVHQ